MGTPLRPVINRNKTITYDFGKGKGLEILKYKGSYFDSDILTRLAQQLKQAKMDNQGNISASSVNRIFLNICDNVRGYEDSAKLKPLFDACTSEESEGGSLFTTKEQQKVMSIIREWSCLAWK